MDKNSINEIEKQLAILFLTPEPEEEFKEKLHEKLKGRYMNNRNSLNNISLFFSNIFSNNAYRIGILITIVFIIIGPKQVFAFVESLLGFIPEVGFVEDSVNTRFLQEYLEINNGDITLSVETGVFSSELSTIKIKVQGLDNPKKFFEENQIPNKNSNIELNTIGGNTYDLKGYSVSRDKNNVIITFEFEAVPVDENELLLSFSSLPGISDNSTSSEWKIPLLLTNEKSHESVFNAVSISNSSATINGIRLKVLNISAYKDKSALELELEPEKENIFFSPNWWNNLKIINEKGENITIFYPVITHFNNDKRVIIKTQKLNADENYIIILEGQLEITSILDYEDQNLHFIFDPTKPQENGKWLIDKEIIIEDGKINLKSADITNLENDQNLTIEFYYTSPENVKSIMVFPIEPDLNISKTFITGFEIKKLPNEPIKLYVGNYQKTVSGKWEINFSLSR